MKIDESMKKEIKEAMEKIQAPSSLYEFAKNINEESEKRADFEIPTGRKRGSWKFKYVAAAVVSLGVLTGSDSSIQLWRKWHRRFHIWGRCSRLNRYMK
jgi:hypothetical protein